MPHQFKISPDHPAVAYLVRLHADIGGRIQDCKTQAERLADAMKHVEAVIRIFDPAYDVRRIAVRRRVTGNPWFKRGTLYRHALDVLRQAKEPLTVREIVERMLAAKGVTDATSKAVIGLMGGVHAALMNHDGETVVRVGAAPVRWKIQG
jgi:hypothetical protein